MSAAKGKISGGSAHIGGAKDDPGSGFHVAPAGHVTFRVGDRTDDHMQNAAVGDFFDNACLQRPTFTGADYMTGSRTGITKDTTNTAALQQLDQWLETYLVDSPPPPTSSSLTSTPTQISVGWTNIPQHQLAFSDGTYTPYVHEMLVQYIPATLLVRVFTDGDDLKLFSNRSFFAEFFPEFVATLIPGRTYKFIADNGVLSSAKVHDLNSADPNAPVAIDDENGTLWLTVTATGLYEFDFGFGDSYIYALNVKSTNV